MPVGCNLSKKKVIYQREQYEKGGIGRLYWDYRDRVIFENIQKDAKVILDAGCGEGITLEQLCNMYTDKVIKGIDINRENIAICKRCNLPAAEGDILNLDIQNESIDCCILSEVIEHLEHHDMALIEIRRILKKGGRLIIVFPNDFVFKIARLLTFKFKEAFYNPGHLRQWTPWTMRHLLNEIGFKIIKQESIPFNFWMVSLHHLVVARKE